MSQTRGNSAESPKQVNSSRRGEALVLGSSLLFALAFALGLTQLPRPQPGAGKTYRFNTVAEYAKARDSLPAGARVYVSGYVETQTGGVEFLPVPPFLFPRAAFADLVDQPNTPLSSGAAAIDISDISGTYNQAGDRVKIEFTATRGILSTYETDTHEVGIDQTPAPVQTPLPTTKP